MPVPQNASALGFGAILNNRWIRGDWGSFTEECSPSIEYLELFALCTGVLTWQTHEDLINTRITVFCDNQAVVHMINKNTSSCKNCMFLLRLLTIDRLQNNRRLLEKFVSTKDDCLADALSRNQMTQFWRLGPEMNSQLDIVNCNIWPVHKVWQS